MLTQGPAGSLVHLDRASDDDDDEPVLKAAAAPETRAAAGPLPADPVARHVLTQLGGSKEGCPEAGVCPARDDPASEELHPTKGRAVCRE